MVRRCFPLARADAMPAGATSCGRRSAFRVNLRKSSVEAAVGALRAAGVPFAYHPLSPFTFTTTPDSERRPRLTPLMHSVPATLPRSPSTSAPTPASSMRAPRRAAKPAQSRCRGGGRTSARPPPPPRPCGARPRVWAPRGSMPFSATCSGSGAFSTAADRIGGAARRGEGGGTAGGHWRGPTLGDGDFAAAAADDDGDGAPGEGQGGGGGGGASGRSTTTTTTSSSSTAGSSYTSPIRWPVGCWALCGAGGDPSGVLAAPAAGRGAPLRHLFCRSARKRNCHLELPAVGAGRHSLCGIFHLYIHVTVKQCRVRSLWTRRYMYAVTLRFILSPVYVTEGCAFNVYLTEVLW